jgi:hypothetical protein
MTRCTSCVGAVSGVGETAAIIGREVPPEPRSGRRR